ncbi:hypothetical protein U0070_015257 [Myodes glareolus]|uniref:Uncharacterized protein n=1 Tax=Myodes glareolus TaxID=447135 RepID=A0AAW0JZX9_MYOGA
MWIRGLAWFVISDLKTETNYQILLVPRACGYLFRSQKQMSKRKFHRTSGFLREAFPDLTTRALMPPSQQVQREAPGLAEFEKLQNE